MKWETRIALLASIEHWKENEQKARTAGLTLSDIASSSCALCKRFYMNCTIPKTRELCPIAIDGHYLCALDVWEDVVYELRILNPYPVDQCKSMREYLEGLMGRIEQKEKNIQPSNPA